jgi:hypothetical protein
MKFITSLASAIIFALLVDTWARVVWFGFTMWGPL